MKIQEKTLFGCFVEKSKKKKKKGKNVLSIFGFESLWIYHAYDILVLNQEFENGKKYWLDLFWEKIETRVNF